MLYATSHTKQNVTNETLKNTVPTTAAWQGQSKERVRKKGERGFESVCTSMLDHKLIPSGIV